MTAVDLPERPVTARLDGPDAVGTLYGPDELVTVALRLDHTPGRPARLLLTMTEAWDFAGELVTAVAVRKAEG